MSLIAASSAILVSLACAAPPPAVRAKSVLVFTKTAGFRHLSIPDAVAAIRKLGIENGFSVVATESADVFSDDALEPHDAVLFVLTTGDILAPGQQDALMRFVRRGRGFVGVHSAADTEHGWPWYLALLGAEFRSHPAIQPATLHVVDRVHPSTRDLPEVWMRTDEWYDFTTNPRPLGFVHVLATLDESSYTGGTMGEDHPIAWCRFYDGGRSWYTALGHTNESWMEPLFLEHLLGGIVFAAGWPDCPAGDRRPREVSPRAAAPGR